MELVRRIDVLGQPEHGVFEGQQRPGIHFEGEVEVEGSTAAVFGMELHLPDLAQRVGFDKVPLVVHVEAVIYGMVLEIGHVSGHVDDCHRIFILPGGPGLGDGRRAAAPVFRWGRDLRYRPGMDDTTLLEVLHATASSIADALENLDDWGLAGTTADQYRHDLVADAAGLKVLEEADVGVLSEESGVQNPGRDLIVVIDPVDGSTNASKGIPWFATSLCAVDRQGARAALVVNQASGVRFEAVRGGGARRDGVPIQPSGCQALGEAIVAFSGYPPRHFGWLQYRCLGSAALDLCAVAEGVLDAYAVVGGSRLGSWDYLGGMLVCTEAGAVLGEAQGQDLITVSHSERRSPFAAATPSLLAEFLAVGAQ
jgi:myo-inositol-1(or 4)-monophosphatase